MKVERKEVKKYEYVLTLTEEEAAVLKVISANLVGKNDIVRLTTDKIFESFPNLDNFNKHN
jgi:hypothetical protein